MREATVRANGRPQAASSCKVQRDVRCGNCEFVLGWTVEVTVALTTVQIRVAWSVRRPNTPGQCAAAQSSTVQGGLKTQIPAHSPSNLVMRSLSSSPSFLARCVGVPSFGKCQVLLANPSIPSDAACRTCSLPL